jgi:AhpD family alkylhydroperoxidase
MPRGKLPRRETELVIMRVAHLSGNRYEFEHHARFARKAGLSREDIDAITQAISEGAWSHREGALLAAVDQLHTHRNLEDHAWATLRRHLDERDCIEFVLLVGHYEMLATFIETVRVPLDSRRI